MEAADDLSRIVALLDAAEFEDAIAALRAPRPSPLASELAGRAKAYELFSLASLERDEELREVYVRAKRSTDREFLLALGSELSEQGLYEIGIDALEHLSEVDQDSPIPPLNLALALQRDARHEEALVAIDDALERDADFKYTYSVKGDCLRELGRWREAADAYREYLDRAPDDSEGWQTLAIVCEQAQVPAAADTAFARAERLTPDSIALHYARAGVALGRDDLARLRADVARLEQLAPRDFRALLMRAQLTGREGDATDAWPQFQAAYRCACLTDDSDAIEHAALACLEYGVSARDAIDADALVADLLTRDEISHALGDGLRELDDRRSPAARLWQVLVSAIGPLAAAVPGPPLDGALAPYCRPYQIWADSQDQAEAIALELEQRAGGALTEIAEAAAASPPVAERIGIAWRGARIFADESSADA